MAYRSISDLTEPNGRRSGGIMYSTSAARRNGTRIFKLGWTELLMALEVGDSRFDRYGGSGIYSQGRRIVRAAAQYGYVSATPWNITGNFQVPFGLINVNGTNTGDTTYSEAQLPPKWRYSGGIGTQRISNGTVNQGWGQTLIPTNDCCGMIGNPATPVALFPRTADVWPEYIFLTTPTDQSTQMIVLPHRHDNNLVSFNDSANGSAQNIDTSSLDAAIGGAIKMTTPLAIGWNSNRNITCRLRSGVSSKASILGACRFRSDVAPHGMTITQWCKGGQDLDGNILPHTDCKYVADVLGVHKICFFDADVNDADTLTPTLFEAKVRETMALLRSQFGNLFFIFGHNSDAVVTTPTIREWWDQYAGVFAAICDTDNMCALCITRAALDASGLGIDYHAPDEGGKVDATAWVIGGSYTGGISYVQSGTSVETLATVTGRNWLAKHTHTAIAAEEPYTLSASAQTRWSQMFMYRETDLVGGQSVHLTERGQRIVADISWDAIANYFGMQDRPAGIIP